MNGWRNPKRVERQARPDLGVCHFEGCDEDAYVTVGITPLCVLHENFILDLLDAGTTFSTPERSFVPVVPGSAN